MSQFQTIKIYDVGHRVAQGFPSLKKYKYNSKKAEKELAIADKEKNKNKLPGEWSEVGDTICIKVPFYCDPINAFVLRKDKPLKLPNHLFWKVELGDTLAAFSYESVNLPAIGTRTVVEPQMTHGQNLFVNRTSWLNARALFILHLPIVLGMSEYLFISTPDVDNTSEPRGVYWRPATQDTLAFFVPWNSERSYLREAVPGQSGLALTIKRVNSENVDDVATPVQILVLSALIDVYCAGLSDLNLFEHLAIPAKIRFTPLPNPTVVQEESIDVIEEVMDAGVATDTTVAVSGDPVGDQEVKIDQAPTEGNVATTEVDKLAPQPKVKKTNMAKNKRNATALEAAHWSFYQNIALTVGNNWNEQFIDGNTLRKKGASFGNAYARNIWSSGSQQHKDYGTYMRSIHIRTALVKPQQISGVLLVRDSNTCSNIYIVPYGDFAIVPLMPSVFSKDGTLPRDGNNPSIRTNRHRNVLTYKTIIQNRTGAIADIKMSQHVRLGDITFAGAIKQPPKVVSSNLSTLFDSFILSTRIDQREFLTLDEIEEVMEKDERLMTKEVKHVGQSLDEEIDCIAPAPIDEVEEGEIVEGGEDEELLHDEFGVLAKTITLTANTPIMLSIPLHKLPDEQGDGNYSTIAEKFEKAVNITPTKGGNYGPQIAEYSLVHNLDATRRGQLAHASMTADSLDIVAARILNFGSILSLASSALSTIGGSSLGGLVETGRNLVNGLIDGVSGILGGNKQETNQNERSLTGPLEIPRSLRFLRPNEQSELQEPTAPVILMELLKMSDSQPVDIQVWVKMIGALLDRSLRDRTVLPDIVPLTVNSVLLSNYDIDNLLQHASRYLASLSYNVNSKETLYNNKGFINAIKLKLCVEDRIINRKYFNQHINLLDIINYPLDNNIDLIDSLRIFRLNKKI